MPSKKVKQPLLVTHPELAKEADGWDPNDFTAGSGKKLLWKCHVSHSWFATVSNRSTNHSGCPYCSGRLPIVGETDLGTTFPDIASEADGWDAKDFTSGSNQKKDWVCHLGHKWRASINSRCSQQTKCPVCSGRVLLSGFNDIKTKFPKLSEEADGWDPSRICLENYRGKWKCSQGHTWVALVSDRRRGDNCPYCSGRRVLAGFNDLGTTHPHIASQAFGWDPTTVTLGSRKKLPWICAKGHSWYAQTNDRVGRESGCPVCANRQLLIGFNDLATTHPHLAAQAVGWDPTQIMGAHSKKLEWVCSKGHRWHSQPLSRTHQDTGCLVCLGKQVLAGFNDLATTHPELARQADGWNPSIVNAGSNKRLQWKCREGHTWKTQPNSRTGSVESGCPTCSKTGFDPNAEGFIYFISQNTWEMFQIGITNDPDTRLGQHRKLGWELLELRGPMDGHLAQQWETAILRMLRAKGADLSNKKIAGKFDGYSEAWSKSTFKVSSIKELMKLTEEYEEEK